MQCILTAYFVMEGVKQRWTPNIKRTGSAVNRYVPAGDARWDLLGEGGGGGGGTIGSIGRGKVGYAVIDEWCIASWVNLRPEKKLLKTY